ncbi:MAG TPA: DUF2892 domain-containing protein [Gemmatimonadales bacterium]
MTDTALQTQYVIRRFAGVFVLASLALGWWVHPAWFLFTAFVGLNLLQSSFTHFCPLETMLARISGNRKQGPGNRDQAGLR